MMSVRCTVGPVIICADWAPENGAQYTTWKQEDMMTDEAQNFDSELEMLRSKLTVLEKGRHEDDPDNSAKIKECQERIAELEERERSKAGGQ
jgi:hypothetical protein